ncbi:MAG: thiamine ABC transporter substrate binding subunit [Hahellaceae bacterium]|nr:thiamine ABC transporter substrate binding subunit [Hahellaceae bacterium]MCP5212588.1 thiamine ABC transporter substrate binding subunit [Hahellaceae bacterium]
MLRFLSKSFAVQFFLSPLSKFCFLAFTSSRRGLFLAAALASFTSSAEELTVYTYDSFVSEWGPGPKLEAAFEKQCACDLVFVAVEDGVSILNRMRIEKERTKADVILGIDDALMEVARKESLVQPHSVDLSSIKAALKWHDEEFVPFDYGYFSFVYDSTKVKSPVSSLQALVNSDAAVIYQDPRTSTPGQGLMIWMKAVYGEKAADAWQKLSTHTVTVTKGWWEAYSMFLKGDADYVLSYSTSPAYHIVAENKDHIRAAKFAEGHVAQVEVAALTAATTKQKLGNDFLRFLISAEAQAIIPVTNWMLPVVEVNLPDAFSTLIKPERIGFSPSEVAANRQAWIKEWRSAASR